jgi:hypothetical protein
MTILVVVSDSSGRSGSNVHHGSAQPAQEGKGIVNYTVRLKAIPIHMGNGIYCLSIMSQFGYLELIKVRLRILTESYLCFVHLDLRDKRLMSWVPYVYHLANYG